MGIEHAWEGFGTEVSRIFRGRDVEKFNLSFFDSFANIVVLTIDMFCMGMPFCVLGKQHSG